MILNYSDCFINDLIHLILKILMNAFKKLALKAIELIEVLMIFTQKNDEIIDSLEW